MPRLKTESEVATLSYLREKTTVPVPRIYHYDSNPWNRLGGEFILMSKVRLPALSISIDAHDPLIFRPRAFHSRKCTTASPTATSSS